MQTVPCFDPKGNLQWERWGHYGGHPDLEGIKDTLSTKMTDHYEKVTHFAVELTETEFADLHQEPPPRAAT